MDKREGHVFVGNLLVADESFRRPLLNVEQTESLCGRLTAPQLTRLDGNVYVRRGETGARSLITWSPAAGEKCTLGLSSTADLTRLQPKFEVYSRTVDGHTGALFNSPELKNYDLVLDLPAAGNEDPVPAGVLTLVGWKPDAARVPGAYPVRR